MSRSSDQQLLREYAGHQAEAAFGELVQRYVNFVYSAALRMVCDAHLAQDVTQGVFVALARSAGQLSDVPLLSGWLHRTTQNLAANAVRSAVRRRAREQEAAAMNQTLSTESEASWQDVAPHLDTALGELNEPDRDALLLRYFERKSAREMAQILGTSEEAAQKRVSRAVDRLRDFFVKRGITVGSAGLAVVISANAVQAAPAGLAVAISASAALSATTLVTAATLTKALAMTTLQKTIIAVAIAAGVAAPLIIQHQTQVQLREENQALRQQADQVVQLTAENERLSNRVARAITPKPASSEPSLELLRLRGQVGQLRQQNEGLAKLLLDRQLAAAPEFEPSSSWRDAGNATPEAAAGTFAWAIKAGDKGKLAEVLMSPDVAETNSAALVEDVSKMFLPLMGDIEDSRLVFTDKKADDEITLWFQSRYQGGNDMVSPLTLKRIGDNWKVMLRVGGPMAGVEPGKE